VRNAKDTAVIGTRALALSLFLPLLGAGLLSGCETLFSEDGEEPPAEAAGETGEEDSVPGLDYSVEILGVEDSDLKGLLEKSSQLFALIERPPATRGGVRRRAEGDMERFGATLRSEGYYAATSTFEIVEDTAPKTDDGAAPLVVRISVDPGPAYKLSEVAVRYPEAVAEVSDLPRDADDLDLEIGMRARAVAILTAQNNLILDLKNLGYPFAEVTDRKTTIRHDEAIMRVAFEADPGPLAHFGAVSIEGTEEVDEDYVRVLLTWQDGDLFSREAVDATRRELLRSGLFASAKINLAEAVDAEGRLPVTIDVLEAKHRSVGFGAKYSTGEGAGVETFWEHRNFFGRGERLRVTATAAQIEQMLDGAFRKPNFLQRDQALLANLAVRHANTDAFDEVSAASFAGLERPLGENWTVTGGLANEYLVIDDDDGERTFLLFGLPGTARRDTTDNLLNPSKGTRLTLSLTPWVGTLDESLTWLNGFTSGSAYYAIDQEARFVLAGRGKLGVIVGEDTAALPANKRFYAGGGGSVRGYEFQKVGPLDDDDDPLGGRSVIEVGAEVRARVTESVGLVPFIDGGMVYDDAYPDFSEEILWAAGLGVRYFTAIGPVRFDLAFPLNGRDVDDSFQFYISIGQAF
jgi:translocation and assembly module TamA